MTTSNLHVDNHTYPHHAMDEGVPNRFVEVIVLAPIAIAGGALLGMVAAGPGWGEFGAFFGALGGVLTSPLVCIALIGKRWAVGLPIIYVPTTIAAAISQASPDIEIMPVVMIVVFVTGCIAAAILARDVVEIDPMHCENCDYSLIGLKSDRCPECGSVVRSPQDHFDENTDNPTSH